MILKINQLKILNILHISMNFYLNCQAIFYLFNKIKKLLNILKIRKIILKKDI